jgi:HD-GYP domain-containing protein (c-di-GMP phosphodiesterase class II)
MKAHPARGASFLAPYLGATPVPVFVRHHHEHFNGNGYPDRLTGPAIPLGGRIVAVADAFESMTEGRPYRAPLLKGRAIEELLACSKSQFDPVVTMAIIDVVGGQRAR